MVVQKPVNLPLVGIIFEDPEIDFDDDSPCGSCGSPEIWRDASGVTPPEQVCEPRTCRRFVELWENEQIRKLKEGEL